MVAVRTVPVVRRRRRRLVSLTALSWALYGEHGELDPAARMVLVVLADHAGTEHVAWPSRATMAAAAGVSHDTVERRLRELTDRGLIRRAEPAELPAAWHGHRADRRPHAYRLAVTGTQPAYPSPPTGTQTPPTGTQHADHGYAAVRTEPKEPNTNLRARARDDSRPDALRPCPRCRHLHRDGEPCLRRQPADVATRGAAAARAALAERVAVAGMVAS